MQTISITNLHTSLSSAVPDTAVGISLATLAESEGFALYATEIPPGNQLKPHYHREGAEFYQVVSGEGLITLQPQPNGTVAQHSITSGDVFVIPPMTAHQLTSCGTQPLVMIFGCSPEHLGDDRHLLDNTLAANTEAA